MAEIIWPSFPLFGQLYTSDVGVVWRWNGYAWDFVGTDEWPPAPGPPYLVGQNFILVDDGIDDKNDDPLANGVELVDSYTAAQSATPNASPLSENNRITLLLPPGIYELPSPLVLDTPYVDLCSISGNKDVLVTLTGGGDPIDVQTDNINLIGINAGDYELEVDDAYRNVNIKNSGNNRYTIEKDGNKCVTKTFFTANNGNEYVAPTTIFYHDYTADPHRNFYAEVSSIIRLRKSPVRADHYRTIFINSRLQPDPRSEVFTFLYNTLAGGTLNVGDTLEIYDGTPTLLVTGTILHDDTLNSRLFFERVSGTVTGNTITGAATLTDTTTSATANISGSVTRTGILPGNLSGATSPVASGNALNMAQTVVPALSVTGPSSVTLEANSLTGEGFVKVDGNPLAFYDDTVLTNDLSGTAVIVNDTYTGFIYIESITGTWEGALTVTGDVSTNTANILDFSNTWEYNINVTKIYDSPDSSPYGTPTIIMGL